MLQSGSLFLIDFKYVNWTLAKMSQNQQTFPAFSPDSGNTQIDETI